MDFNYSEEAEAFRRDFRAWLQANVPHRSSFVSRPELMLDAPSDWEFHLQWHRKMHAAGWVGISWPKQYGGRGASFMQQVVFDEEYFRARAPVLPTASALNLLGPTLIHWGTEEQKKRHLPRILSADEVWCQGY